VQIHQEDGAAVILAVMASGLLLAAGTAIVLTTTVESSIASAFRGRYEVLYAADAGLELAISDLRNVTDWSPILSGLARSVFVDGSPSGSRVLADGSTIDLGQVVSLANCQKPVGCTVSEMNAVTIERPWGSNNPRWQPYLYGRVSSLVGSGTANSSAYVVVLVGDDPSENDGDPALDGVSVGGVPNPGLGVLLFRAEAFGVRGAHRMLETTLARTTDPSPSGDPIPIPGPGALRVLSWRQIR
jgi:hypothetical protein